MKRIEHIVSFVVAIGLVASVGNARPSATPTQDYKPISATIGNINLSLYCKVHSATAQFTPQYGYNSNTHDGIIAVKNEDETNYIVTGGGCSVSDLSMVGAANATDTSKGSDVTVTESRPVTNDSNIYDGTQPSEHSAVVGWFCRATRNVGSSPLPPNDSISLEAYIVECGLSSSTAQRVKH